MEKREKIEQAVKERERVRLEAIPKKWNKREEYEFLRVLTGYGVDLQQNAAVPTPDWHRFKQMARLEKKSDESLSDYYKVFIAMCKRQAGVRLMEEEKGLEGLIDDISEDHARLVLDRLELLSKLREVGRLNNIEERLSLCQNNYDTPDWYESGKHDKELIRAVLKHGLYRSEHNIFNDTEFSFLKSEREYLEALEKQWIRAQEKLAAEAAEAAERLAKAENVKKEQEEIASASVVEETAKDLTEKIDDIPEEKSDAVETKSEEKSKDIEEVKESSSDEQVESTDLSRKSPEKDILDVRAEQKEVAEDKMEEQSTESTEKSDETADTKADEIEKPTSPAPEAEQQKEEEKEKSESSVEAHAEENKVEPEIEAEKLPEEPIETTEGDKEDKVSEEASDEKMEVDAAAEKEVKEAAKSRSPSPRPKTPEAENEEVNEEKPKEDAIETEPTESEEKSVEIAEEAKEKIDDEETVKPAEPEQPSAEEKMEEDSEETPAEKEVEQEPIDKVVEESKPEAEEQSAEKEPSSPKDEKMETSTDEIEAPNETEEKKTESSEPEKVTDEDKPTETEEPKEESVEEAKVSEAEPANPAEVTKVQEPEKKAEETPAEIVDEDDDVMIVGKGDPDDDEVMKEKENAAEEECKKQAEALKARFPDLEVIQPLAKVKSSEDIADIKPLIKFENPIKIRWFRDFALEKRISHIIYCIEHLEWPVNKNFSAYTGCQGMDLDVPLCETVKHMPPTIDLVDRRSATPDVITITTDQGIAKQLQQSNVVNTSAANLTALQMQSLTGTGSGRKRKRHIAIDVETERAKLHALLNSSQATMNSTPIPLKQGWPSDDEPKQSKRSSSSLQPPPAHQHISTRSSGSNQAANFSTKSTIIPGTSSTLTPIDLSSSLPKSMKDLLKSGGAIDLSEVQDFSMSKKMSNANAAAVAAAAAVSQGNKGKLDDMLSKLMKKNNYVSQLSLFTFETFLLTLNIL